MNIHSSQRKKNSNPRPPSGLSLDHKDPLSADLSTSPSDRYEKLYWMLMETIPSSVLLLDRHLCVVSANRNFLTKSRRNRQNTVGRPINTIFSPVILHEMKLEERILEVFQHNKPLRGERMAYRAPGIPLRIYYYSLLPVAWEEDVEHAMLLMDDVTEQIRLSEEIRQVERHLASVVESASDIVVSTDPQGRIVSWNRAAEMITGFRFEQVKGAALLSFCIVSQQDLIRRVFYSIQRRNKAQQSEWALKTADGQEVLISWIFSPMKDEDGKVIGVVVVGRDLTERRKLEAQILQAEKLTALGVMAGGIAHEIRNPLAVASSAAQFLLEDLQPSPAFLGECAEKIHLGIRRASDIIENLLRFARPSLGQQKESFDLVQLAHETIALVANEAKLRKVELESRLPHFPLLLKGHSSMIQQLLMNLLLNALKATPQGGSVEITLSLQKEEVFLWVEDTGRGIPPKDLDKIFDPFYTTHPVGDGTGLGLSLCYSIVKQHGGTISVESAEGKGSLFTIRLPRR